MTTPGARRRSIEGRLRLASDHERGGLLDALAAEAAAGGGDASQTLTWAVHRLGLARPAIRQYLFQESDVDTAEQQTLIAVAQRIGSFRGDSRFTTWLHRVAANEAEQVIRSEARHRDRIVVLPEDAGERVGQRISSMIADRAVIQREIDRLPEHLRRALVLREHQDLTYEEIAGTLDVPLSTAKTWVRRGRAALAARLADQLGRQGPK